jgi:undecaprenyl-diphosphatase
MPHLIAWERWNIDIFEHIHATTTSSPLLITLAAWLAELPLFVALALTVCQIVRKRDGSTAARLVLASGCALLIEALMSTCAYHPRPFAAGFGPAWVMHAANNSMPSTHTTLVWTMAIIMAVQQQWCMSAALVALGCALAWARVYVGIHWPADMVGAAVSAGFSSGASYWLQRNSTRLFSHMRGPRSAGEKMPRRRPE